MRRIHLAVLIILCAASPAVFAQAPASDAAPAKQALWRSELPGGTYEVAVSSILGVSTHQYLVDAVARVTEVNIDTPGMIFVRFYYLEPATPALPAGAGTAVKSRVEGATDEAASRAAVDPPWKKVTKSYPTSTHARTVEYRLLSKEALAGLFKSVQHSFRTGEAGVYKAE